MLKGAGVDLVDRMKERLQTPQQVVNLLPLKQQLAGLVARNPDMFEDARGHGLLLGLKCKGPNQDMILAVRKQGLLTAGAGDNVMRILPPLVAEAGLLRAESRGTHFRDDHPQRDDARFCRRIFLQRGADGSIEASLGPKHAPTDKTHA